MQKCYLPGRKHALYRLSEVEQVSQVRIVEKSPELVTVDCSVSAERVIAAKQLHALPSPLTIVSWPMQAATNPTIRLLHWSTRTDVCFARHSKKGLTT